MSGFLDLIGILIGAIVLAMNVGNLPGCGCQSIRHAEREELKEADFQILPEVVLNGHTWKGWETKNEGPLVVLLHEITGLSQTSLHLAKELSTGPGHYHVIMPLLFGSFGEHRSNFQFLAALVRNVGSRWDIFSDDSLGTIRQEAAAFCAEISRRHGGQRLVVIGNCLTGSWPVALLREPSVCAGIVCQPALPLWPSRDASRRALGIKESELQEIATIAKAEKKPLMGIRYLHDKFVKDALPMRFERLETLFGIQFHPVVLATSSERASVPAGSEWIEADSSTGHSTLTENAGLSASKEREPLLNAARAFLQRAFS